MRKTTKKFSSACEQIEEGKLYTSTEAIELVKKISYEKFDAAVEVHIRTGIDIKKSDQQVRSSVVLPAGTGRSLRIAVFAEGDKANEAKAAGADIIFDSEGIKELKQKGVIEFDVAIGTPDMMRHLASVAKLLGPRGLMPSPKNDTVTTNVAQAVELAKKGKVDFRNDDSGNIHQPIGKVSFSAEDLMSNYRAFLDAVKKARPSGSKGAYIRQICINTTMGPSVGVEIE